LRWRPYQRISFYAAYGQSAEYRSMQLAPSPNIVQCCGHTTEILFHVVVESPNIIPCNGHFSDYCLTLWKHHRLLFHVVFTSTDIVSCCEHITE
jgi:xanthine/CO dehydrogenase XdhC/CoxF family maturation factor